MPAQTARTTTADGELDRARSDYLAVSRSAHLYASTADHLRAEERAWERLQRARAAVTTAPATG